MPDSPETTRKKGPIIEQGYVNSICELQDEKNQLLAHCRITSIVAHTVELRQRDEEDVAPALHFGMPVKMNVYNVRLGLKILAGIVHGYHAGIIRIAGVDVLQESDRREFVRVPTIEIGTLYPVNVQDPLGVVRYSGRGAVKPNKEASAPTPVKIRMENVSLSGLQFSCFDIFHKGDRLIVSFSPLKQPLRLQCEVVRAFKDDMERWHYGCRLLQMHEEELDNLSKILMKLQQSQRAKQRDQY